MPKGQNVAQKTDAFPPRNYDKSMNARCEIEYLTKLTTIWQ